MGEAVLCRNRNEIWGRVMAECYPASQLGSIARMIEDTQLGSIQIFIALPEFFTVVDSRFELFPS